MNLLKQEIPTLECGGRLYALEPKVTVCLTGHALALATKYFLEKLRCALCGKVFTATPPTGTSLQKYDEALKANLAIAKNYGGMPFYRLQKLQNMVGVPFPHATQWKLTETLADDIYPIYYELEHLAAQGKIISHDDTTVRILSLMLENKEKAKRGERVIQTCIRQALFLRLKAMLFSYFFQDVIILVRI